METDAEFVIETDDEKKDETVVESLEPGYFFFGEPLVQELVKIYKYEPSDENRTESTDVDEATTESTAPSEENATPELEGNAEIATTFESQDDAVQEKDNVKDGDLENEEQ
jgi:hypothetical protein